MSNHQKKIIEAVIAKASEAGISGNNGDCGFFALALQRLLLKEFEINLKVALFCAENLDDPSSPNICNDLISADEPIYHVALSDEKGALFDIDGNIPQSFINEWIKEEYGEGPDYVYRYDIPADTKYLETLIHYETGWRFSLEEQMEKLQPCVEDVKHNGISSDFSKCIKEIDEVIERMSSTIKVRLDTTEPGIIHIDRLDAISPGHGHGTNFFNEIIQIADKYKTPISLVVDDSGDTGRLFEFYARMGFMRNETEMLHMKHACHMTREMIHDAHQIFYIGDVSPEINNIRINEEMTELTVILNHDVDAEQSEMKEILKSFAEKHGITTHYMQKELKPALEGLRTGQEYAPDKTIATFEKNSDVASSLKAPEPL